MFDRPRMRSTPTPGGQALIWRVAVALPATATRRFPWTAFETGWTGYKWPAPAGIHPTGAVVLRVFGKRTCKPNSVVCGHSSRRRVAADAHQRPTRRFRQLLEPPVAHRADTQRRVALERQLPSLFGLAPCGVYPASGLTIGAVRSYRTFSPLPRHRIHRPGKPGWCFGVALNPIPRT